LVFSSQEVQQESPSPDGKMTSGMTWKRCNL